MPYTILCRARVSPNCLQGLPSSFQFEEDLPLRYDGTFDGESIVCDACYAMLVPLTPSGAGLNAELDDAINTARSLRQGDT